uniref:GAF domain-containing protein n=1 Tax=Desertifilum tharense IPPAS B-1220 TaxID=1781255 RepID=A0ACD5GY76_9CYAN
MAVAGSPEIEQRVREYDRLYPCNPQDRYHPLSRVLHSRQPEIQIQLNDRDLEAIAQSPQQLDLLRSLNLQSFLCFPLVARDQTLGAIALVYSDSVPILPSSRFTLC